MITGQEPNATLVAGIAIVGYGLFVFISAFSKRDAVKKRWPSDKHDIIYISLFIVAAIFLGGFLIAKGLDKYNLNLS